MTVARPAPRMLFPAALALLLAAPLAAQDPTRVLVIYSTTFPDQNRNGVGDSLEVAQRYAARRGVPAGNLLGVACSTTAYYYWQLPGWTAFFDEVVTPVNQKLQALGPANIDTLCWCYGVPYQVTLPAQYGGYQGTVTLDELMRVPTALGTRTTPAFVTTSNPYAEPSPTRPPDLGHFDHSLFRSNGQPMYLMARLDGASPEAANDLVESALYAERYLSPKPGYYQGIGYVDTQYRPYTDAELQPYPFGYNTYGNADQSMAFGKFFVQASGYQLKWENTATGAEIGDAGATFHDSTPALLAPNALWYGGWYNYGKYNDVWSWLPGSAAIDLNSNSLQDIRNPATVSFLTKAFARGLTCGTGCVTEPYLSGHPQPEVFLYYMLNGFTFAEAASLCNPLLAWVNFAVGDPLYAPTRAGRVPILDTTAPPVASLQVATPSDTQRVVTAAIDVSRREPDVVVARVDYGTSSAYGSVLDFGTIYRTSHALTLDNLTPDRLYHQRVTLRDPVGNTSQTSDTICYTRTPAPALAGLNPPTHGGPVAASFDLDLTLGHLGGVAQLSDFKLLVSAPHLNITDLDLTAVVFPLVREFSVSPGLDLANLRIQVPGGVLFPGTYTFKLRALAAATMPDEDTATVTLQ